MVLFWLEEQHRDIPIPLVWWRRVSVWSIAHWEQPLFRAASPVSLLGLRLIF